MLPLSLFVKSVVIVGVLLLWREGAFASPFKNAEMIKCYSSTEKEKTVSLEIVSVFGKFFFLHLHAGNKVCRK